MDLLTTAGPSISSATVDDLLLCDAQRGGSGYEEELELLSSGQVDILSGGDRSPFSNESGITSPGTFFDDDFLDGLLNEEITNGVEPVKKLPEPKTQGSVFATSVPSTKPMAKKLFPTSGDSEHKPKVKMFRDGQKLSESEIERNRKNAISARVNRQRKKDYVSGLQDQVRSLSKENDSLTTKCTDMERTISRLEQEVVYLKSVLANQSTLSYVLRGLSNVKGVRLSGAAGEKRPREDSEVSGTKKVKIECPEASGGICLHIAGEIASLELCSQCSSRAAAGHQPWL